MQRTNQQLILVMEKTRQFVMRPENDFSWSGWEGVVDALKEIDACLDILIRDPSSYPMFLEILYAPTGPLQELSLSSGWGDEFLVLAGEFDAAIAIIDS